MNYYTQSHKIWKKDIMTGSFDLPGISNEESAERWNNKNDTIGRYGCLITSLVNAYNFYNKRMLKTPFSFNKELRNNKGYKVLKLKQKCPISQESFLEWDVSINLLNIKNVVFNYIGPLNIKKENEFYILRCPYNPIKNIYSGHYNLIVDVKNSKIIHFDSDKGVFRYDFEKNKNYHITQIIF